MTQTAKEKEVSNLDQDDVRRIGAVIGQFMQGQNQQGQGQNQQGPDPLTARINELKEEAKREIKAEIDKEKESFVNTKPGVDLFRVNGGNLVTWGFLAAREFGLFGGNAG